MAVVAPGHHFLGVLVAQLVEAELAQPGDMQGLRQQDGGVELLQLVQGAQVLLAVGQPAAPQLADAGVVAQGGEHIVQGLARGLVHLHIAAGHHGDAQFAGHAVQGEVAHHLVVAQQVA